MRQSVGRRVVNFNGLDLELARVFPESFEASNTSLALCLKILSDFAIADKLYVMPIPSTSLSKEGGRIWGRVSGASSLNLLAIDLAKLPCVLCLQLFCRGICSN